MTAFPISRVDKVASVHARIGWKALTASEYQDDGYVFLSTPNIKGRSIDFENVNYISEFRYRESPELMLQAGDVLLAKDGSTLGIAALVTHLPRPSTVNGSIAVLRCHGIDPAFLRYVLQGAVVQGDIQRLKDGMGVPHLFQWDIRRLPVPLPPWDVQRRIADFLDDQVAVLDSVIERRKREHSLLEDRQRSLLAALVTDRGGPAVPLRRFLRPRQELDRADLRVLSVYRDHGVIPRDSRKDNFNKTPEDLSRYQRVAIDDLVVNKMKAWSGSVAVSPYEGIVSPDYLVCDVREGLIPQYLHLVLRSPRFVAEMGIRSRGIRPNQERLYWDDLASVAIPIPDRAKQWRVVEAAAEAMASIDGIRRVFSRTDDLLNERKRSLITAVVAGEFDIVSASSRAAEAALSSVGGSA